MTVNSEFDNQDESYQLIETYEIIESPIDANKTTNISPSPKEKILLGLCYMCSMGVCGVVLVALGSTLSGLAKIIGVKSTDLGTVFIARGVGAVIGAISSAKLYLWFNGNHVMSLSLLFIFTILVITPYNKTIYGIHTLFFFYGLNTSITDTGENLLYVCVFFLYIQYRMSNYDKKVAW